MAGQRPDDGERPPTLTPDALTQLHRYRVERGVDAAWLVDVDGLVTHANDEAARIVGRSPSELVGLSITAMLDAEGARQFDDYLELMRSGHPGEDSVEVLLHRPDGTPVWTLTSWRPLHDDDGVLLGWGHTFAELSDHRRIVDKLRLREKQLAHAQAVAHVGSWELRSDTGELWWSDELYRIVGRQPALGPGSIDRVISTVHPDDRPSLVQLASRPTVGFSGESWTGRIVRPDGSVRWVRMHWLTHQSSDDDTMRVTGTMEDVTELQQSRERAERAREDLLLLQDVAEAANRAQSLDAVLDRAMEAVAVHSGWRATGYLRCDPAGTRPPTWHPHPQGCPEPLAADLLAEALGTGRPATRPREEEPGHSLVAVPVLREDEVVRVVEMSANTPEPGDYLALAAHAASILGHVALREHVAAQLGEARDAALQASEHKSAFLAAVSHELRTPMNGVIGLADLLLDTALDDHQRRLLTRLRSTGDTLVALISDILDFSSIESGHLELTDQEVDPRALVDRVAGMLAGNAAERGLDLAAWCDTTVPATLRGDPLRLEQVLLNLGSNAVKFTDRGHVVLRADPSPDGDLRLAVSDTGIGLDLADRERLLLPFTQGDGSSTRRHGGTGLGLTIVDRLVGAMGGRLEIESTPGSGSTFTCVLPLPCHPRSSPHPTTPPGARELAGTEVLVLGERPATRASLVDRLRGWGARVVDDHRRGDADPDLVVLDLGMPHGPGAVLSGWPAADENLPASSPLLVVAGLPGAPAEVTEALGARASLATPVGDRELLEAVRAVVHGRKPDPAAGTATPDLPEARAPLARVLVVEDDAVNQLVARGFLERLGIEVEVAEDGVAAVDRVTRPGAPPLHAVLMDCRMPRLDGYGATRAIRAAQESQRVPIIALTASAVASERERCLEVGMDDFLTKPVDSAALARALARWVPSLAVPPAAGTASTGVPPDPGETPVLDLTRVEALSELVKDGVSFFVRTRASFLARAEEVLRELLDALDRGETDTVVRLAHSLKGAAGNLGLARLAEVAAEVEEHARHGRTEPARAARSRLGEQMRAAVQALRQHPG